MATRSTINTQSLIDSSNYVNNQDISFGSGNPNSRGQTFLAGQTTISAIGFNVVSVGSKDIAIYLSAVTAGHLPTGATLQKWTIPNATLRAGFRMYNLSPFYTGMVNGTEYAIYFYPELAGVYSAASYNFRFQNSNLKSPRISVRFDGTTWTTEALTMQYAIGYPVTRTLAGARSAASGRVSA